MSQHDPAFQTWIDDARARSPLEVAQSIGFAPKNRTGNERFGPCPTCGGNDRFSLVLRGSKAGVFHCRGCGAKGAGAIDLVMQIRGLDFMKACEELAGPPPKGSTWTDADRAAWEERRAREAREREDLAAKREAEAQRYREAERARLFSLWRNEALPLSAAVAKATGSSARAYLEARGIDVPEICALRQVRALPYFHGEDAQGKLKAIHTGPAMLAVFQRVDGRFGGLHITWFDPARPGEKMRLLDEDGEVLPAKKMRGTKSGCAIPICGAAPTQIGRLFLGEGIETVLSVRTALARAGRLMKSDGFWTSGDLGNLGGPHVETLPHPILKDAAGRARRVPGPQPGPGPAIVIPPNVRELVLLGDGDSDPFLTQHALARAAARWRRPGLAIRTVMAPEGADFNDVLRGAA